MAILIFLVMVGIALHVLLIKRENVIKRESVEKPFESKGDYGEKRVAQVLGGTIPGKQYIINDILFETKEGKSCQIDHIYINKFGVWVIETKNYSGKIYGMEKSQEWKQYLAYGKNVNAFYNPVKQNASHIYHLSQYLDVVGVFQNVVVFLGGANISGVSANQIYTLKQLPFIKTKHTNVFLSEERMEQLYHRIKDLKAKRIIDEKTHLSNISKTQEEIRQGICPRCRGKLVVHNGAAGQFYGCSNYPNCTFTKPLK